MTATSDEWAVLYIGGPLLRSQTSPQPRIPQRTFSSFIVTVCFRNYSLTYSCRKVASLRTARARCETAFFSSVVICAKVRS